MNRDQIEMLLTERAYPHAVRDLRLIETHISWVILTGDYVYKIKKPVSMGFLDFSTLAKRQHFCDEEVSLNRRLAPQLYIGVAAITMSDEGPVIGGEGEVIEYAVHMHQFSQRHLASRTAAEGRLTASHCRELGQVIAEFHNSLAPIQTEKGPGTPAAIFAALRQNFEQIDAALPRSEERAFLHDLEGACISDYERLQEHMWQRLDEGFVRECHGDLHLGNIVILDDDAVPFDCLEFNPDFRLVDIQCEIGFLIMDLESRSLPGHANRVLNRWLEHTGDYAGLALHSFYDCYLAMVRAKISLFAAIASNPDDPGLDDYRRYFGLAAAGRRRQPRFLCITMGVSGSGKSTVAETLCAQFSAIRIRSDVERKRIFGLAPGAASNSVGLEKVMYSEESSDRVFKRMLELASTLLDAGLPVVVDATFIASDRRKPFMELAQRNSVPFIIAHCTASEKELARRLVERNRLANDASEAGIDVMLQQQENVQMLTADEIDACLIVDTQAIGHDIKLADEIERRITSP